MTEQPAEGPYSVELASSAARDLSDELPEPVAAAVYELINGPLRQNPYRVGKTLRPPLAPALSARRGTYRVLYVIDEDTRTITVTAVSHRAHAYRA
ncbi:type II toxin-antitoxin system RelE/ParE family toxin [Quadrisphaera sp. DSM 44207]|uniref:type II toxin-antitoxin system RelE family toxin n=1 Tax=Quadrisphaera sp. DSM 44207 TaxID=1881057 RepID=UPI00087E74DC|nr:type II toxin-antitoxin system RelE/ParE family toxin [Quadrisphaera sp. DSM 44207]SDQ35287.1 mRNA-degrading endonuclease RelE, toxin component of the RelBE toxin-antitoxin system [Quadrisphaera sp. DSM 44207]